jgi:hypothetical protein
MINPVTMFNFSCKSDNIIQHGGDELAEEKYYFLRLANEMYPIMNFDILSANFEGKTKIKISKEALKESEENKHKVDAKKGIFVDSKDSKKKMFDIKNMFSFIKTKKQKKSNDDTNTDNGEA